MREILREVFTSRSGFAGLAILAVLGVLSAVFLAQYGFDVESIVDAWNDDAYWLDNPRLAAPEWVNLFGANLPRTSMVRLEAVRSVEVGDVLAARLEGYVDYYYDDYPSEVQIIVDSQSSNSFVELQVVRPDGKRLRLMSLSITRPGEERINVDSSEEVAANVERALGASGAPSRLIFDAGGPLKGTYEFVAVVNSFDKRPVNISVVVYGKVHGLAGTDEKRRDIFMGISMGIPIAYMFGLVTAFAIVIVQSLFGIVAGWFGGRVDAAVDRLADIFLILPFLPILIMVSFLYRLDLLSIIGVIVALSLVGSTTKVVRSMTLQIKSEAYIEAARALGASSARIILVHIFPRVLPYSFALVTTLIPSYVYLEAALAILGLGDPFLPTLGKIISEAFGGGAAFSGYWWWVLIPSAFLVAMTVGFSLIGYAFDKVLNPRLREQ